MSDSTNRTPKKTNRSNASGSPGPKRSTASSTVKKSASASGTSGRKSAPRAKVPNARSNADVRASVPERKTRVSRSAPEVSGRAERKKDMNAQAKRDDIIIIVVTLLCVLMFLSYLGICGIVGTGINAFVFGLFGRLGYILPFIIWILTVFFIANKDNGVSPLGAIYAVLLSAVLGALIQLAVGGYDEKVGLLDYFGNSSLNYEGEQPTYGGILGGVFVKLLCPFVGKVAAVLILIALLLILFVLMTGKPFIMAVFRKIERRLEAYRRKRAIERSERDYYEGDGDSEDDRSGRSADNRPHTKMRYGVRQNPRQRMGTVEISFGKRNENEARLKPEGSSSTEGRSGENTLRENNSGENVFKEKPYARQDNNRKKENRSRKNEVQESPEDGLKTIKTKVDSLYIPGVGSVKLGKEANINVHEEDYTEEDFEETGVKNEEVKENPYPKKETTRKEIFHEEDSNITSIGEKKLHSGSLGLNKGENNAKIIGIHNSLKNTDAGEDDLSLKNNPRETALSGQDEIRLEESGSLDNVSVIGNSSDRSGFIDPSKNLNDRGEHTQTGYSGDEEIAESVNEILREDENPGIEAQPSVEQKIERYPEEKSHSFQEENAEVNKEETTGIFKEDAPAEPDNISQTSGTAYEDRRPKPVSSDEIRSADAREAGEQYAKVTRIGSGAVVFSDTSQVAKMMEAQPSMQEYKFPPISFLKKGKAQLQNDGAKRMEMENTIQKLQSTFESFGVGVKVTDASVGPTVTRYELLPDQGVKVKTITALSDDIKLALAAAEIRIEAPIPGKAAVGIEVPNKESAPVLFGDLIDSDEFKKSKTNLAFAVGKDISGKNIVSDIGDMPHALIAGATGSGKSVCINALIMSILYKAKPNEVKMIMVDPKRVELVGYNGIPHLIVPVVTDVKKAAGALAWAVAEMDDRYKRFANAGVRDLAGFNKLMQETYEEEGNQGDCPDKLPQIVIIVDELNDLMMTANSKEVEADISRLTQLARACGIHVILATQRPSVNVITGTIKANIPTRIAFAVSSIVDSRTILDQAGAEKLLGKGDMLFYPRGCNKPVRLQGVYVSDDEVNKAVEFIKEQYKEIKYNELVNSHIEANAAGSSSAKDEGGQSADANANDPLFIECGRYIIEKQKSSVGALQRVFKIGFNRAARIMDQLSEAGVVGPEDGTKARTILMSKEQFEEFINN